MKKCLSILFLAFLSSPVFGFLPPVTSILREVVGNRKAGTPTEVTFRHTVRLRSGETVSMEERILYSGRSVFHQFKNPDSSLVSLTPSKSEYKMEGGRSIPHPSQVFDAFWGLSNPDDFRDVLMSERFLRRDQLTQFNSNFAPTGDPALWQVKDNYIRQNDIFLSRKPNGISIAIQGSSEPGRTWYVDKGLNGIRRFEWKEGQSVTSWDFYLNRKLGNEGFFPQRCALVKDGQEIVTTDLISRRALNAKTAGDWQKAWSKAGSNVSPNWEEAIRTLLTNR